MTLKTGMLVGIVGSEDIGVLIQIRASSNTCVIKLNNGTLKKNVPLEDVEEAKDMSDTKGNKTPIRLGESPVKPTKLASMPVKSPDKVKTTLEIGDSVRARCNGGSRWFPGKILRVNRDGTYDVEYSDGDIEKKMAPADVEFVLKNDKKLENLTVGDMVKARYQKGSKLFSGKITRVRSDGTYDIKYDDGDVETRVARDLIEPNSEGKRESDEAPIMRKSGFRVDQSVKARYNGGKKLFPGKIKRVHSDGTYDVLYEDGDEEKRVKAEHIEATNVKDGRDEDIKPVKTSSRSKPLTVGKKVKAHYKKGKRLFPGKITRVRSDGTYDIDYDDGEIETRVEAAQIEVDDEEDLFADSDEDKKPKTTTKKKKWIVGDRVKAYYGKGKRLFPGKIAKLHMNGTYDIKYDDGDSELRVDSSLIQDAEDDKEKLTSTNSSDSPKSKSLKEPLRVGDSVKAKYKRGAKFFSGKITRARMDGTFDIKYEDGDVEERVEADLIQRDDDEDKSKKKRNFEVGDVVKAPFQRGNKLFRGKISRVRSDGTYDVAFDDGDKDSHVPANLIQSEESDPRDEKPKKNTLKVGDSVNARYKKGKKLFDGKVTRVRSDGTYDIEYDDGDVEMRVDIEMIEVPEGKKSDDDVKSGSLKSKKSLKVGDKVRARYNKGSKMISGEIAAVHRDGTYDIRYEDGDKEKNVAAKDIEIEEREPESKSSSTLRVGDSVKASYKNGVKMFPGKISRIHSDGTYDITFNDGDSERRVPRSRIRSKSKEDNLPKKKNGFSIGDAVKAKYKMGTKYFPGKIARIRSDGTYDIEYDDGDSETHVDASLIVSTESETATKPVSKMKRFEVGDVVKARYKKGTKLFSGKITRVRSDGTYDIKYDDGDTEMHVESSHIEAEEELSSQDKKPESFTVGDKVNARYKGGLKRFPGKILKVRMDGTYDIEYDDGDTELRVKSSAIELIPDSKPKKIEAKASLDKDDIFGDSDSDDKTKKSRKSAVIKVGDVVEANFKQKGKFHRGKIVRVRSDGTFDIEYDVGASEGHVQVEDIKTVGDNQESGDKTKDPKKRTKSKSSNSDQEPPKSKSKKSKKHSSSESPGSDHETQAPIKKGARVTYRKAEDSKSRRIGIVRKVHSDGSCDVQYDHGETSKRVARKLLVECSDSEGSEDEPPSKKVVKTKEGPIFRRHERVLSSWRRSSKLSKPRMTEKWTKAMVLEKNADGTYTIRYSDGVVEEDVPSEALKPSKKKNTHSDSDGSSGKSDAPRRKRKREFRGGIGTESLFLLEQLAMTLFEEGFLKKKPKLQLLRGEDDSSSSDSSSSSTESGSEAYKSSKRNEVDKVLKRLFDSSSLQNYKRMFKENDVKNSGKISRSRIIALVENLISASRPTKESRINDDSHSVSHILSEWFATHDDLRIHRHFKFKTLMLAFAYAKCRLGKLRMEQSVATVLEGRFASYHENKRQLEIWQQKLGYRLFQTLQRNFHDHALPHMIPSRIRVSELSLIFEQVARQAIPNKPLDVYLQQQQLFPHHTLLLPEFLCCYYQLYGSENSTLSRYSGAVELRPIAFVASCLFSNGDIVCKRHGDLVRRLCVGRTPAQVDFILRFREAFESLLSTNTGGGNSQEELLLETSQLSVFAAKVVPDPSQLEPALTTLRKRSGAVSLVEIYGSCGFIIDELTSAPTIRNVVEKMRMRVDLADVRRIVGIVRNICVKILRFPNNADYWRIRVDNAAFQQKIGRFDGATSLLEAVGFVEHQKTHYELRGARDSEGKRVSALEKSALDSLREKCVQLDGELSLFDGVESLSSILERISKACEREGSHFALEECQMTLKNLSSYIENILKNPKDSRCWRIREANRTFQRQIGYLPYATELMESIGFDLVQTSHGNVYTLRGTGMTGPITKKSGQDTQLSASLSNFAFSSVSSQMEWFLWRRKQEIDSLLEDEMRYLHDIVGQFSQSQNNVKKNSTDGQFQASTEARDAAIVKMYPYGTNAIETFNKTSIQRRQIDMMRDVFKAMDVDQKVFLLEADFSRVFGSPSSIPAWSRFEAFDIGKDGKVDIHDFVAALGPLLDHPYELKTDKNGEQVASLLEDNTDPTLCEATSLAVGGLRLQTSCAVAATVLEGFLNHLFCIIQEPGNSLLWSISDKEPVGTKLLRFTAGRELLRLVGFRESSHPDDENIRNYELQPQRVRFKTSKSVSELPTSLDTVTISRIQTIAAMLAGHYRGIKNPSVSDVSAVSRAISTAERCSENWARVVQLAVKCLMNIENQPENPRYREINTATNTFTNIVNCVQGGLELLLSIGFRETDSGTLAIPLDTSLDVMWARRLELEVGLALLHLRLTTNDSTIEPQTLSQSSRSQPKEGNVVAKPAFGTREHLEQKKKMLQAPKTRQQNAKTTHRGPVTARKIKTNPVPLKQRPHSARTLEDPIEQEILADVPHDEVKSRGNATRTFTRQRSAGSTLPRKAAIMEHNRSSMNRKQVQRRAPNKPPPANGHSMVLAANASAGADTIVVQRGQFVLRGAYMRIGAGIPDLHEERMVVEASSDEHTQGLTKLRLGIPLRFFHPAKELVSTVLLSSVELTKCLEISDTQTFAREIIINVVAKAVGKSPMTMESCSKELPVTNLVTTLVTSFEPIQIVSLTSSNLCVGPSMRYIAASNSDSDSPGVSIIKDQLSDRKLQAYWEGILLQAGISNKKVRLRDVKQVVHRNAYLSLMLPQEIEEDQLFSSKSDDFQVTYEEFRAFFQLPKRSVLLNCDEENEAKLQLPFTYLRKHFQLLLQAATSLTTGYKSVQAFELLRRVQKDVQDHTRVVSDDPQENTEGVELTLTVCQDLERAFVDSQRSGLLMWPEIVYFVRYNKRLMTPEMFPSLDTGDALVEGKRVSGSGEVAELVSGIHTSRVLVLYFDGCVEVWNLSSNSFVLESKTIVLFSTKKSFSKGKKERSEEESTSKSYMQACMDANQTGSSSLKSPEVQRSSSRIRQFKRSTGASGALVRFCAWDSVLCVNSSILQESGSETFRFFRLANNFVCPIRQVAVEHVKVELSTIPGKGSKRGHTKKSDCGSSSGVVKQFKVTKDGSKIVFLTGSETILWVACAGTGEILCHFNLQVTQVGNFQALFQMVEKHLPSGEIQTQLYATTTAKSYRHAGMWILPQGTKSVKALEKKRAFSFGNVKVSTVVHLDVRADLLFVASRDGSILVWSTTSDQSSPISPLVCLKIRLRSEELQSICCQTLREECKSIMIAGDTIEIDRWEVEVLQQFNPPPLRFALYLFDDGEIIRLAVSDKFDVRLVTLEDPAFEFDKFLAPVSGVEHNQARRVTLQKNQIIRVLFIALHHSRNGIFAQKAVQEFFKDLENHGMLWKTRDEMIKFAASYQKNVDIQLQIFYRHGDGEQVELTQPQHLKQDNPIERVQDTSPVLVVGAVLKSRTGDQAEFQIWKFATNWLTNEEFEPEQYQVDHARRALSLQSSYRLEADRVLRIRRDISRGERMLLMENRRAELVQSMKDNVRDIIAQIGRPDDAADRLLKSLSVFMLMSFDSQVGVDPVEAFFLKLFNQVPISDSISSSREISSFIEFIRSEEGSCLCFGAWVETVLKELTAPDSDKGLTGDWLSLLVRHVESTTFTTAELGAMLVDLGLANAITGSNSTHSVEHGFQSSLPSLMQQLHRFLCIDNKSLTFESAMDELLVPQIAVEFIVDCTNFSGFFQSKMEALSTSMTKLLENDQNIPEASYAMHLKARKWQNELRQLAQSQNTLQSKISGDGELEILKPTAEDLQHLQRFLMTPLPCVSLNLSSITLENRCDPIHCRDRFVMNASGRSEDGEVFVPLSVLYLFMDNEEKANRSFKQELTFLRKVQHLRAREFFLPACLDLMSVPILPTANGSMVCGGDSDEIRCIVAGSLKGWSSLSECLNFMRSSTFSIDYWKPLLWSWSIRVLMMLLTTQSERFSLRKSIDMDMLLVSPDGSDLRLCTLSVGEFVRFGESEDEVSLSRATAQVFGCFIYQLLHTFFSSEDKGEFDVDVAKLVEQDIDGEKLLFLKLLRVRWELEKMRN
ncbi:hypothetical protein PC116_g7586 [Phytophthora cactorum]|uniref:Uncharacterized protein n=1 Tax=Phytophthora cactorum TaxID=29920 RepID=A0A8T1L780_9STRA|nr:hypothetical protein PC112_g8759 [Phytophthora cactorum]KAG2985254.1 hypothetical protein PC118_g8431 [Phytophthora cactorum]KAG4244590.1 hypothetical protein PC116_g7586 [Phytophthora cactorum]